MGTLRLGWRFTFNYRRCAYANPTGTPRNDAKPRRRSAARSVNHANPSRVTSAITYKAKAPIVPTRAAPTCPRRASGKRRPTRGPSRIAAANYKRTTTPKLVSSLSNVRLPRNRCTASTQQLNAVAMNSATRRQTMTSRRTLRRSSVSKSIDYCFLIPVKNRRLKADTTSLRVFLPAAPGFRRGPASRGR